MKILYIHMTPPGSEKANLAQVVSMCDAFSGLGAEVTLAVPLIDETESSRLADQIFGSDYGLRHNFAVRNLNVPYGNPKVYKWLNGRAVQGAVSHVNPDLCYVRSAMLFGHCVRLRLRTVFESHNAALNPRKILDNALHRRVLRYSQSKDTFLVAISEALAHYWIVKGVHPDQVLALHDGFSAASFELPLDQLTARERLYLPIDRKLVVYTGSLYSNREIESIIYLAERIPEANFLIVGGPDVNAAYFREIAHSKGMTNIRFTGRVIHREVPNHLFAADVLLALWSRKVPTINYCSPLKVFEYMAAGRVIVAHAFPTIREVLTGDKTALLVDPDSREDLILKVRAALAMEYPNAMAKDARTLAFREYSWGTRAERILAFAGEEMRAIAC